jgi:NAD-binding of NADP-dependent 3-hydroxyisobutyrate dehydrogenase
MQLKLFNNMICATNLVVAGEALSLELRLGRDAKKMYDVISNGTGASWVLKCLLSTRRRRRWRPFEPWISRADLSRFGNDQGSELRTGRGVQDGCDHGAQWCDGSLHAPDVRRAFRLRVGLNCGINVV